MDRIRSNRIRSKLKNRNPILVLTPSVRHMTCSLASAIKQLPSSSPTPSIVTASVNSAPRRLGGVKFTGRATINGEIIGMAKKLGRNSCPCGSNKKYKHCCLVNSQRPSMPARPRQHELDTEAVRYISSQLPSAWPHQEIPRVSDYGKDLRVEIFENNRATAMEFVIQIKGHERFRMVNGDQSRNGSKSLTLNYYERSSSPVLLAVYSAQEKQAKYLWIRPYIRKVLDVEKPDWRQLAGDSTITLHVPLGNHFDHLTHRAFLSHVESEHANRLMQSGGIPCSALQLQGHIYSQLAFSPRLIQPKIGNYLARPRLTEALSQTMRGRVSSFIPMLGTAKHGS